MISSQRVDHFLCISTHVKNRVKKYYRMEAEIVHPPVETNRFHIREEQEDFFLIVSSFTPYKGIDLAIEAFNHLGYPLKIIGSGPEGEKLRSLAGSNIEFLGWQPDEAVSEYYSKSRALIFPGEEDFGIVPLEAMASGRPVIAYGRGGALETIVPYRQKDKTGGNVPTGLFFHERKADSVIEAIKQFEKIEMDLDPSAIRNHALQWDRGIFKEKIKKYIYERMGLTC